MTHLSTLVLVALTAMSPSAADQPYGRLTVTEDLIRREIVRLGGDWESGAKPMLVAFLGDKFESRHFEMLTHLPTAEWFVVDGCSIDYFALACLSQVHQLERLDITRSKLESECFSLLRGNRELKEIYFESIALSDEFVAEIARLGHIRKLIFTDCDGLSDERLSTLTAALPDTVINAD
jgi:hypothetical protein